MADKKSLTEAPTEDVLERPSLVDPEDIPSLSVLPALHNPDGITLAEPGPIERIAAQLTVGCLSSDIPGAWDSNGRVGWRCESLRDRE